MKRRPKPSLDTTVPELSLDEHLATSSTNNKVLYHACSPKWTLYYLVGSSPEQGKPSKRQQRLGTPDLPDSQGVYGDDLSRHVQSRHTAACAGLLPCRRRQSYIALAFRQILPVAFGRA